MGCCHHTLLQNGKYYKEKTIEKSIQIAVNMHPLGPQESTVHAFWSLHTMGVEPHPVCGLQKALKKNSVIHYFLLGVLSYTWQRSEGHVIAVYWQPVCGLHESEVHRFPSSQEMGVCMQPKMRKKNIIRHWNRKNFVYIPKTLSHTSAVHLFPSSQANWK